MDRESGKKKDKEPESKRARGWERCCEVLAHALGQITTIDIKEANNEKQQRKIIYRDKKEVQIENV